MMSNCLAILLLLAGQAWSESYSNHWSTLIPGGLEAAKKVSEDTGCELLYEIIPGLLIVIDMFGVDCRLSRSR